MEGSTLNAWGANSNTPTIGVKSYHEALMMLDDLEQLVKIGRFSDRKLSSVELAIKEINQVIKEQREKLSSPKGPPSAPDGPIDDLFKSLDHSLLNTKKNGHQNN